MVVVVEGKDRAKADGGLGRTGEVQRLRRRSGALKERAGRGGQEERCGKAKSVPHKALRESRRF